METQIYRTQNYQQSLATMRNLFLLVPLILLGPMVLFGVIAATTKAHSWLVILGSPLLLLLPVELIVLLYYSGYKHLAYQIGEQGLKIRYLGTRFIPWSEIVSVEEVNPMRVVQGKIAGIAYGDLSQGFYSTTLGRAYVWLAGEKEGLFIRTPKRNYLIAPERLNDFISLIRSKVGQ